MFGPIDHRLHAELARERIEDLRATMRASRRRSVQRPEEVGERHVRGASSPRPAATGL